MLNVQYLTGIVKIKKVAVLPIFTYDYEKLANNQAMTMRASVIFSQNIYSTNI